MKVLKELRRTKKITQDKLADILRVSRSTISMWEIDASEPDTETVRRIADFFDVSTDYLLGRTDDPNPQPLVIPDELKDVRVAFHKGDTEDLTQDEVDKIAEYVKFIKEQRKKRGE